MSLKIEFSIMIIYLGLISQINQIYYISFYIRKIDDCLSKVYINDNNILYEDICTKDNSPKMPHKNPVVFQKTYTFREDIIFEIYDKHGEAFIGIDVKINEYTIKTELRKFWKCINCEGNNGDYIYNTYENTFDFYNRNANKKNSANYIMKFNINSEEELINLDYIVNKSYYTLNKSSINQFNLIDFNKEICLIDFNNKKNIYVTHNENHTIPFDTIYFKIYFDNNILHTGKIMGFNFKNKIYEELHNQNCFQINEKYSSLNYIFSEKDKNNRSAHIKINIITYNSPNKLNLSQTVSNLGSFEYIFESDGNINCSFYHYNITDKNIINKYKYEYSYYCTETGKCPEIYNKLIEDKKECVDRCEEDDIYKFEFKKKCYRECPSGSMKPEANSRNNIYYCKANCTEEKPFEIIELQECVEKCSIKELKQKICELNYYKNDNNYMDIMLKNIELDFISKNYNTSYLENGEDDIFEIKKMNLTLTTLQNQNNNSYHNMTKIDLGQCESSLREVYKIPNNTLFIKKVEVFEKGMKIPKIEFDIYCNLNGTGLIKLDLSIN